MVDQIYPYELQLNKANSSNTEAPFFYFDLSIMKGIVPYKIYDKWNDFNFKIVNFPFLDEDVLPSPSYVSYISHSPPDSVHTDVNYGSFSKITDRVEN